MKYFRESGEDENRSKREQILDAAYQIFSQKGYHRTTIDEIIALADTGKGTVYNYFVNKEQLFYTLIREKSAPFEVALAELVQSPQPPLVKVEAVIKLFLRFYVHNADLWRVMMHEMRGFGSKGQSNLKPEQQEKYRDWFRQSIGMLEKVLHEGIEQGVIRECDVTKSAYGLFSVIVMMVFQKLVGDDIDGTAKSIADIFLYGVARQ
ncbi:TetR family transcriptional regulator [Anaerospora hongkongensis]|uniref:TetR family transcriptional regulator n=2 Tax=Anaerospora hongkongensis TaxID=244830 RepID=A0A4R1Q926_9FIRM|nr:TetR/AcrR family transcriptional regulator [Anaerospora hongkongensis]TCL39136.1 TetR family transcriptional regulator [Anaerospora hongkongensis]